MTYSPEQPGRVRTENYLHSTPFKTIDNYQADPETTPYPAGITGYFVGDGR